MVQLIASSLHGRPNYLLFSNTGQDETRESRLISTVATSEMSNRHKSKF